MPRNKQVIQKPEQQDFVECQICHKNLILINNFHLKNHGISLQQYKQQFPSASTCSQMSVFKMGSSTRGKNRPEFSKTISGKGNGMFGRKHSKQSLTRMSLNRKGKCMGVVGKYERKEEHFENFCRGTQSKYKSKDRMSYKAKSSWELSVMIFLDLHPLVEWWQYEPFRVRYKGVDGEFHKYRPDFIVNFSGIVEVWEVKPEKYMDENAWIKIDSIEKDEIQKEFKFYQVCVLNDHQIKEMRKIDWEKTYLKYGFTLDDLENTQQEMVKNVRINDIVYNNER